MMNARMFYTAVLYADVNDELKGYAREQLNKMENALTKRQDKVREKNEEYAALVAPFVTDEPKTAPQLVEELAESGTITFGDKPVTAAKIRVLMDLLIKAGSVARVEIKDGHRKLVAYQLVTAAQEE